MSASPVQQPFGQKRDQEFGAARPVYYEHDGKVTLTSVVFGLLFGLVGGCLLAFAYSYVLVYVPIVGIFTFALAALFGAATGFLIGLGVKLGRTRSKATATLVALVVLVAVFYVSWAVWVYATLSRADVQGVTLSLALRPDVLWPSVLEINRVGAWSMKGGTPTGVLLWILWTVEAGLIFGPGLLVAPAVIDMPFCNRCDTWCEQLDWQIRLGADKPLALGPDRGKAYLTGRLEQRDWTALGALGAPEHDDADHFRIVAHQCTSCKDLATLTAARIAVNIVDNKREEGEENFFKWLVMSGEELEQLRNLRFEEKSPGADEFQASAPPA